MKCPIASLWAEFKTIGIGRNPGDCLKEECAWWDKEFKGCSILELNRTLYLISSYCEEIRARMPHEGQFRK